MEPTSQHRGSSLYKYRSPKFFPNIGVDLLATQITGFVHMVQRTHGIFPLSAEQRRDPKYQRILDEELKYTSPPVGGGILADAAGMGKTITA
jgi:hypothetical protein